MLVKSSRSQKSLRYCLLEVQSQVPYTYSYKAVQVGNVPGILCSENADVCCEYKVMEQHNSNAILINLNTV